MTKPKHLINNYYAVEIPADARTVGIGIAAMYSGRMYVCYDTKQMPGWDTKIILPAKTKWSLIGISDSSEEQAQELKSKNLTGRYAILKKEA